MQGDGSRTDAITSKYPIQLCSFVHTVEYNRHGKAAQAYLCDGAGLLMTVAKDVGSDRFAYHEGAAADVDEGIVQPSGFSEGLPDGVGY